MQLRIELVEKGQRVEGGWAEASICGSGLILLRGLS